MSLNEFSNNLKQFNEVVNTQKKNRELVQKYMDEFFNRHYACFYWKRKFLFLKNADSMCKLYFETVSPNSNTTNFIFIIHF